MTPQVSTSGPFPVTIGICHLCELAEGERLRDHTCGHPEALEPGNASALPMLKGLGQAAHSPTSAVHLSRDLQEAIWCVSGGMNSKAVER